MKFFKIFIVLLFFTCGIFAQDSAPTDAQLYEAFTNWMTNYGIYYTDGDMQSKFQSWKENNLVISEANKNLVGGDIQLTYQDTNNVQRTLLDTAPVISYPNADSVKLQLNELSDIKPSEFYSHFTGHIPNPAHIAPAIAAAGLSAGAIAGIAVGGAAFVGLAVGGGIFALKKAGKIGKSKESSSERSMPSPIEMQTRSSVPAPVEAVSPFEGEEKAATAEPEPEPPVKGGINVFDHSRNPRHSITARDIRDWDALSKAEEQEKEEYQDKL